MPLLELLSLSSIDIFESCSLKKTNNNSIPSDFLHLQLSNLSTFIVCDLDALLRIRPGVDGALSSEKTDMCGLKLRLQNTP